MFADGPVAQAAQQATDDGAVFLSAAGNSALDHYVGAYDDGAGGYHEFASGDTALSIVAFPGARVFVQWSDAFGQSSNDFDLYACLQGYRPIDFNLQNGICWASGGPQDGDDDPIEGLAIDHPAAALIDVFIHAWDLQDPDPRTTDPPQLKLYVLGGRVLEHGSVSGGIFGHPAASGVLAVGAIPADDPGNNDIESFSDQGPVEIYHPTRETRQKPDITAIDGVAITGAGGFSDPFYGTSAASPHAAGIAALVMQAERKAHSGGSKSYIAGQVFDALRDTAVDLGATGFDTVYGYGRVDALAAVAATGLLSTTTFVVDSAGDGDDDDTSDGFCEDSSGDCSLRAAIEQANAGGGGIIEFNIVGDGPHTILPATALPTITQPVVIDGSSQPAGSSTAQVQIELDGTNAGADVDGLTIQSADSIVRGLAINRFGGDGISVTSGGSASIRGNLIGTGTAGAADQGNGGVGISLAGAHNRVWDNVISGNDSHGVSISGPSANTNYVAANFIGTDSDGDADLGNTGSGVLISGSSGNTLLENVISRNDSYGVSVTGSGADDNSLEGNLIGTSSDGEAALGNGSHGVAIVGDASDNTVENNTIAHNGGDGVNITGDATSGNAVWENGIHSNTGLGIDLGPDGVTVNDGLDVDTGPHGLQNFPVLISAGIVGDEVHIYGSLNAAASTGLIVDFYTNESCGATGNGEGQAWLGWSRVATNAVGGATLGRDSGVSTLLGSIRSSQAPVGSHITATATGLDGTSEFSACVEAIDLPELDLSATSVSIDEADSNNSAIISVALAAQPAAGVSVQVVNTDSDAVSSQPETFAFATDTWDTVQDLTITAVDDADASDEDVLLALYATDTANRRYYLALLSALVEDDDLVDITLSEASIEVNEGSTETYTVALAAQPSAGVEVSLTSFDTSKLTVMPASLTFTTDNWNTTQDVTVTGVQDADGWNHWEEITHEITLGGETHVADVTRVLVQDDDRPRLELSAENLTIAEGNSGTYTAVLTEAPSADVTITLFTTDSGAVTGRPGALDFSTTNWDTDQTVTVEAVDDDDGDEELVYIGHQVTVDGEDFIIGVVAVAVTDGDTAPYFLDGDTTTRSILENSPAGTDVGEPIAAGDPEGGTLTYSVAGDDASFFSLDTANGQLSVASGVSFDYENPGDRDSGNDYEVTLTVTDPDNETDTSDVTVSITNDPEGALWSSRFTLGRFTTFVGAGNLFTGVAIDPDRFEYGGINAPIIDIYLDTSDGTLNFCLDGSLSSYRNEGWSLYADGTAFAFSDSTLAERVDKDCYSWAHSGLSWVDGDTVAMALGDPATVGNVDLPPDAPTALRVAPEAGDPNGSLSIAWTDPYNAGRPPITDYDVRYRIAGTEAWTGVTNTPITSSPLTLPGLAAGTSYDVQIRAVNTRGAGGWSSSGAGTTGTDGNDPPYFLAADAPDAEIAEDAALGDLVGAPVAAADPDSTDTLTYALSGAGSANFDIDGGGQITVASRATLDHETTPSYFLSVAVHDGKDADGNDDTTIDDTITVTINVTNIEEPGEVTFSWEQPQVDTVLTATLEDPDGGVTNLTWQWAKSPDGSNNWTNIGGATSAIYTPVDGDAGNYLRATASYEDLLGMGRSAAGVTDSGVHNAPSFAEGASTTRTVAENTADIDSPVTATDEGGDTLAYTLSGTDQAAFSIDVYSGQLTAANGLGLDYETATDSDGDNSYDVLVTASEIDRYDRRNWDHWNDADDDCQDARQEVLIAESEVAVTYEDDRNCRVETGQWTGAFTGTVVTSLGILDIDHFVPLANAWKPGAWAWDDARKEEYANFLDDPDHLIAVTRGANRSKGARGPEAWQPPLESFHCEYATRWTNIKARWELSVTAAEQAALDEMIDTCATEPTLPALTTRAAATAGQDGSATIDVSVTVTNVDEAGTVTLDSTQPQVGTALTASLTDPDGTVSGESWQWSSSSDQNAWANIVGATLASYTPVSGDVGDNLRATVSYTDPEGSGKSAQADSANAVQASGIALSPPGPITLTEGAGETAFTVTVTNVSGVTYLLGGLYDGGTSSADFSITDSQGNEFPFDTDSDVEFIIGLDESTIGSGTFAWTFNMSAIEDNVDEAPEEIDLYFRIVVAGGLESTYSNDVHVTIVDNDGPSQPTGLTATAGDTQVRLSWDDPADSSITKYQYQETAGGVEGSWEDIPASAPGETNARSFIKRGLTNGTEYSYVILGVIADADGLQSDAAAATPVAATSVPDQPGNFTAEQNGIRRVSLEWDASASPLTIAGYQLTEDGGSEWTAIPDSHSGTASWTVTGLANGATYNFSVRAVNGAGNSDAADAATVTVVARPARPVGFAATPQNGQVWLTWARLYAIQAA